ncbi:MAG: hypothetical protein GYB68_05705, partial [Chloroflexi bacterium]|nr:hypothetical protein [Chloroflexota bacterium]
MDTITSVFWNSEQERLTLLWRLILHTIVIVVLTLPLSLLAGLVAGALAVASGFGEELSRLAENPFDSSLFGFILVIQGLALIVAIPGATWLVGHFVDRRKVFVDFGL